MSMKYYQKDYQHKEEFLAIVDAFGGELCKSWTQVARKYEQQTGEKVDKANTLRYRWEQLTNYSENFTKDQKSLMFEIDIQTKGIKQQGLRDFQKATGKRIYQGRFCRFTSVHIKQALQLMDEVFAKEKKHRKPKGVENIQKIKLSHLSVYILLRAKDILQSQIFKQENQLNDFEKYISQDLIEMSILCEKLFLCHARCFDAERSDRLEQYLKLISRKNYNKLIYYIEYLDVLRKISVHQISNNQLVNHPLIYKDVNQNKETIFYKNLIQECDWQQKYKWYHECASQHIDEEIYSLLMKQQGNKRKKQSKQDSDEGGKFQDEQKQQLQSVEHNNILFDFVPKNDNKIFHSKEYQPKFVNKQQQKKKEYRKFRHQYIKPGDTRTDTRYTKIFTCDDDSNYNSQDEPNEAEERNEEIQELYNRCFLNVPNKKKKQKNLNDETILEQILQDKKYFTGKL